MNERAKVKTTTIKAFLLVLMSLLMIATPALANKTSVKIAAPDKVKKDSSFIITINVMHSANNIFHFTDWVYLKINGKEVQRWKYGMFSRPDNGNFSVTYTAKATEDLVLEAEGDCNLHGSAGKTIMKIVVEP